MLLVFLYACEPPVAEVIPDPTEATIRGVLQHPLAQSLHLVSYQTPLDVIRNSTTLLDSTVLAPDGSFELTVPWHQAKECSLLNGDKYLLFEIFLAPGDTLELLQDSVSIETKGSAYLEFHYAFRDTFFLDPHQGYEYQERLDLPPALFERYIDKRREDQIALLRSSFPEDGPDSIYSRWMMNYIEYAWAVDRLQYSSLYHSFGGQSAGPTIDSTFFDFLGSVRVVNPGALLCERYVFFLSRYTEYLYNRSLAARYPSIVDGGISLALFQNEAVDRYRLAAAHSDERVRNVALTQVLNDEIDILISQEDRINPENTKLQLAFDQRVGSLDSLLDVFGTLSGATDYHDFLREQLQDKMPRGAETEPIQ